MRDCSVGREAPDDRGFCCLTLTILIVLGCGIMRQ